MTKWYECANEASFKATSGGYVFQAPSPWMFARPRHYLVDEAQKVQLLAGLGRWRALLVTASLANGAFTLAIILLTALWPTTFVRPILPLYTQLGGGPFMVLLFVLLAMVAVPLFAVPQIYLARTLRPLLAKASLTQERIKMSDQLPAIATSASSKLLAIGLLCGLGMTSGGLLGILDAYLGGHVASRALPDVVILTTGALVTAYFAYLIKLRVRRKREVVI
jgi:hypothetical protein